VARRKKRVPKFLRTQSHKVYTRPREGPGKGWSRKTKFSTKVKRWVRKQRRKLWRKTKRAAKKQWRTAKKDIRRIRRKRQRQRAAANRQAARSRTYRAPKPMPQRDPRTGRFVSANQEDQAPQGPPPDGAISTCELGGNGKGCGNEIRYSAARQRWEHTGKGNAECFKR
jgi:hypothetical protein